MNTTVRILTPALITFCLALPLLGDHDKPDPSGAVPSTLPAKPRAGEPITGVPLGHVGRASEVIGMEIRNLQDEKLGKVNDLAIDWAGGRIVEVIVSTGGVLGVGTTMIAVPPAALHYDHETKVLHLDRTKESLKEVPPFDVATWDDHFQSTNVAGVYRAYGVEPYFAEAGVAADNTALNRLDRAGSTLTPGDQGNSVSDVAITSRIRKALLSRDGLSVNAQNVKIITVSGRVTLRGPVNSEEEKRIVAEIADGAVQASNVDNQLEIKGSVTRN